MRLKYVVVCALMAAPVWGQAGYSGPQVLSRGGGAGRVGERGGRPPGFSVFAGVLGLYETGIVPASVDSQGRVLELGGLGGIQANIGAFGHRDWRRTTVGLDYAGNYRHYNANTFINGSDHMLTLGVNNQLSRRVQFLSRTSAGTISRYYTAGAAFDSDAGNVANFGIFDNRANYIQQSAGLQFMPTARLAISATGNGWTVRRQSRSLIGVTGYGAQGTASYRLSRTRTLEANYQFNHFDYVRGFGETDLHTMVMGIGQRLGRRWEFSVSAGVTRADTIGLEQIAADPLTAALFGTTVTTQAFSRSLYFGTGEIALRGKFRTSNITLAASQLPTPGNGVFLTSKQTILRGIYSYTGIRRASLSLAVNRMMMDSLGQAQLGTFSYTSGGASLSYKMLRSLDAVAQFDARDLQINQTMGFARLSYRFAFGLNWNPGEFPITFW